MHKGFTLAEVLVTIAIIGVVAMLVIPQLLTGTKEKELSTARTVMSLKIQEAMNQMRVQEKLTNYSTADEFVNELKKYIKITQICNNNNVAECYTYDTISNETNSFKVSELINGSDIVSPGDSSHFPSKNVGIQLVNGTTAILNYNKDCKYLDPITGQNNRAEATKCLTMIYDINGSKKPNKINKDIVLLNAELIGCIGTTPDNKCITKYIPEGSASPLSYEECLEAKNEFGDTHSCSSNVQYNNYYMNAVKTCGGNDKIISSDSMSKIANEIYGASNCKTVTSSSTCSGHQCNGTFNATVGAKYGISVKMEWAATEMIWLSSPSGKTIYYSFEPDGTTTYGDRCNYGGNSFNFGIMCVK